VWFGGFPTSKKEALVPLQQKKTSVLYLIDEAWTTPSSSGTSTTDLSVACSVAPWRFGQLSWGKNGVSESRRRRGRWARPDTSMCAAPASSPAGASGFSVHLSRDGSRRYGTAPTTSPCTGATPAVPSGSPDAERNYLRFCDYY
jgi:hypothetical protein